MIKQAYPNIRNMFIHPVEDKKENKDIVWSNLVYYPNNFASTEESESDNYSPTMQDWHCGALNWILVSEE